MKLPDINLKKLTYSQKETDWHKSVILVLEIALVALAIMLLYIYFKPLDAEVKKQIETEVASDQIKIDTKTIDILKSKNYLK